MNEVPVKYEVFQLEGGLDLVTPTMSIKPGVARDALNWEASVTGGYTRVAGYERTDGRVATPTLGTYGSFAVTAMTGITVGGSVSNGTGATGTVIAINGLSVFYTQQVGTFAVGNTINTGPTVTVAGVAVDSATNVAYLLLAANVYRALITVVPGSGRVQGVAYFANTLYAWRNNAGGTLLEMYKATTSGWVKIIYGYEVGFTTGSVSPTIGGTITKGAVSAVVRRISIESGTFGAGTAAGRFITDAPTGGAFTAGALTAGGTATLAATLSGGLVQALITFLPGGRVQTVQGNFGGASTNRLYGCDNVNRGWEFDGTTMVPIRTGMAADTPNNVIVHKNYLFFSFGPSLQFSGINAPYAFSPILGAGELVMNADITCLSVLPGNQGTGALGVYTDNDTSILYGTSFGAGGNGQLVPYNTGLGASKYTVQGLEQNYALDARGVVGLSASLNFGNFDANTLTLAIRPFIQARRGTAAASGLNREKSQYRIFYADGSGLYISTNRAQNASSPPNVIGSMPVQFPHPVTCWSEGSDTTAIEMAFFGSADGYVRQMDIGTSFDGSAIDHRMVLNFDSVGNPRILKRFRKAALEVSGGSYAQFNVGYTLAYNDTRTKDQPAQTLYASSLQAINWDAGFTWDSLIQWDGRTLGPVEVELVGSGENIAMAIQGSSAAYSSFTINTITVHFTPRRGLR